ncbi:hypothetical protein SESBI_44059 [Sesbania bispinosa]|nr:hypothetical protein SESBI_44059 [Sesbania bispinosa]
MMILPVQNRQIEALSPAVELFRNRRGVRPQRSGVKPAGSWRRLAMTCDGAPVRAGRNGNKVGGSVKHVEQSYQFGTYSSVCRSHCLAALMTNANGSMAKKKTTAGRVSERKIAK